MARGEHPNSRANLAKGHPFNEETARKAQEKSAETKRVFKSLNQDLREQCDDGTIKAINERLLQMAKHGNLKAYELIRDGLGEKPTEKHEVTVNDDSMREMDEFFKRADNDPAEN